MIDKGRWRLEHVRGAIAKVRRHSSKRSSTAAADESELVLDSVLHNIEVIGEASAHLSDGCKALAPEVPWVKIRGMRNLLAHECFDVDAELVWKTVDQDLDALDSAVERLLAGNDDDS